LKPAFKILVVDDEEIVRDIAVKILEESGFELLAAKSGEEALRIVSSLGGLIDLVILDVGMPGMGGIKCLKELKASYPRLKVVISSGSSEEEFHGCLGIGEAAYLAKPYRVAELVGCVERLLGLPFSPSSALLAGQS